MDDGQNSKIAMIEKNQVFMKCKEKFNKNNTLNLPLSLKICYEVLKFYILEKFDFLNCALIKKNHNFAFYLKQEQ